LIAEAARMKKEAERLFPSVSVGSTNDNAKKTKSSKKLVGENVSQ
jgi:hypothetical protein